MKIGRISVITFFLLKTIQLSPVNNPSLWILTVLGGVFFFGGALGKHEIVLLLLLIGISNRLIPAINHRNSFSGNTSFISLSQYIQHLPLEKRTFFSAFLLSNVIYVLLLISLCIYIGTVLETPPVIASICPPQTVTKTAPSGEPLVTVEGIMMVLTIRSASGPFQFKVPVHYSLLFGMLASEVIIDYHKIPDDIIQRLYPDLQTAQSVSDIFTSNVNKSAQSKNYSSFLYDLRFIHFGRIAAISCFIFIVFLIDTTRIYWGKSAKGRSNSIFNWIDYVCYTIYASLCLFLLLDILLPESIITRISLIMNMYSVPINIFLFSVVIAGLIRVLYVTFFQTD